MNPDLVFATPMLLAPDEEITLEQVEELCIRTRLTDDFLKGRVSATDFMDFMNDDYGVNTSEFLDSVEANLNYIVDIYGRPII